MFREMKNNNLIAILSVVVFIVFSSGSALFAQYNFKKSEIFQFEMKGGK